MFNFNTLIRWCAAVFLVLICIILIKSIAVKQPSMTSIPQLLSDPFLQLPTENSVRVVWFTEFAGIRHTVSYSQDFSQTAIATTTKLSRTREDSKSFLSRQYQKPTKRDIWRHEAEVTQLSSHLRLPYRVTSVREDGKSISSGEFTLAAKPTPGTPLKILLTSDHQLKPMTAANLQKVVETVGKVDAVFFGGDLVNIADRASEWFDDRRGGAFFPALQGRAKYELSKNGVKHTYTGGEIIQHAPLYTAIGNHEVMGRFERTNSLNDEFGDPYPRQAAIAQLLKQNGTRSVADYSFNTDTYEEIFTLPQSDRGGKKYYAVTFGDVRLVVLYAANIWRTPSLDKSAKGKYQERAQDVNSPDEWGYGQHIFEDIFRGSPQYLWLEQELNSPQFRQAKYKVVMFHHPPHSLGDNIVPAYTNPVQTINKSDRGNTSVNYKYPIERDYLIHDVVPLLAAAKVQLVFYGHSHLWNRFVSSNGMHFLETSNVGNTYGAFVGDRHRNVPVSKSDYAVTGDPNRLEPVVPTIAPLLSANGQKLPYIASDDITVFTILDTATGSVMSYYFDTRQPDSEIVRFDEFKLKINSDNQ
jgi:Calcineurin-like phosphoesterase